MLAPAAYIARLKSAERRPFPLSPAAAQNTLISTEDAMGETMLMGLRLVREGVSRATFRERFGVELAARYGREFERLAARRLVELTADRVRLTPHGRLLGNQVFMEFV